MKNLIQKVKSVYPDCYVSIGLDVTSGSSGNESIEYTIVIYPDALSMSDRFRQDFETYTALENYVNSLGKKDKIADIPEEVLCHS